jgi:hypothetical protein
LRYKTFVATGIAPDGRLYAGDLNGIQDLYVTLSDFTQTLDVGVLRVGDTSLQLLKYGTGEFRMSGDLRIDGILRALGGMLAGAFTTAQRDAIPAGRRPFSLIIFNTTANQYQWNAGTDASPNWQALGTGVGGGIPAHASTHLPGGSDPLNLSSLNLSGTRAAKPAASSAPGAFYFETDWTTIWFSNGTTWLRAASAARACTLAQFLALPDYQDGDEVMVQVATGVRWQLRYNSGGSTYKWECVGAPAIIGVDDTKISVNSTSYVAYGPSVAIPIKGTYEVRVNTIGGGIDVQAPSTNHAFACVSGPGQSPSDAYAAASVHPDGAFAAWAITKDMVMDFNAAGNAIMNYRGYNASTIEFQRRSLSIRPIRVGI